MRDCAKLENFEQATLFLYLLKNGLPEWAEGSAVKAFAMLLNITQAQALKAFEQAKRAGYVDRAQPTLSKTNKANI